MSTTAEVQANEADAGAGTTVQSLLGRAAMLRAAAAGFVYPKPGHAERVNAMLAAGAWPSLEGASPLGALLAAARQAWRNAADADLEGEYVRLFLGGPACPPHETAYGDGRRIAGRAAELADIAAFYRAFGLDLASAAADLPDHLACELEFCSLVLVKLAYAEFHSWSYRREVTARAAATFLEQHLGRWTDAFAAALVEHGAPPPYRALAALTAALVAEECRRFEVEPVLLTGRLTDAELQDERFVCPRADALESA